MGADNSAGAPVASAGGTDHHRKIRILLVIKVLGHGGAERLLVDMVARRDTDAFDYEVAYVLASEDGLAGTIAEAGTPVHALAAKGNWDLRWVARLRALLIAGRFDVVHFHLPYTASLGRLGIATLPRSERPAIVYTEHSAWDKMAVLVKALNRTTIGMDQSLIVVSEAAHQALPAVLRTCARVIVHGIDLSCSHELTAERVGGPCRRPRRARRARRRAPRTDRGQPPSREGLRRAPRRRPERGGPEPPRPVRRRRSGAPGRRARRPAPRARTWATGSDSSASARTSSGSWWVATSSSSRRARKDFP